MDVAAAIATGGVLIGASVALFTAAKALVEFGRQGTQKRAEQFFALRNRLKNTPEFVELAAVLDTCRVKDPELKKQALASLREIPFSTKRDYLGLFEEVAVTVNSGLMRAEVAHYMFGYYALLCDGTPEFWEDVNRYSPYWSLFIAFCDDMRAMRESWEFDQRDLVF